VKLSATGRGTRFPTLGKGAEQLALRTSGRIAKVFAETKLPAGLAP
jgi:hypothetical protein